MKDIMTKCCVDGCSKLIPHDIEICTSCFREYLKLLEAIKRATSSEIPGVKAGDLAHV